MRLMFKCSAPLKLKTVYAPNLTHMFNQYFINNNIRRLKSTYFSVIVPSSRSSRDLKQIDIIAVRYIHIKNL